MREPQRSRRSTPSRRKIRSACSRDPGEDDQHVEQHRQLELVVEAIADLVALRPANPDWPSAMSRHLRLAAAARCRREDAIQNSRTNVSATCTKTGSRHHLDRSWLSRPRSDRTSCLPKFSPRQQPDERPRRVLEPLGDVLAILDLALLDPCAHVAQEIGSCFAAKSVTMKPRIVSRLVSIARISCGTLVGPVRQLGRVVMRDQPAYRNAREVVEQRKHRVEAPSRRHSRNRRRCLSGRRP